MPSAWPPSEPRAAPCWRQASPASAATTTGSGAMAPAVVSLTDAATIAVDASLGNDFRVTIAASRTMGNPANPTDGQKITFQITQGAAGSATITWSSSYEFSDGLPQPTLSTTAGQTDLLGFIYNAAKGKWLLAAFVNGFSSDYRHPAAGHLPVVPVDQRAVQPGLLQRPVHGRRPVRGDPGRHAGSTVTGGGCARRGSPRRHRSSRSGPCITTESGALIPAATVTSGRSPPASGISYRWPRRSRWPSAPATTPAPGSAAASPTPRVSSAPGEPLQRRNRQRSAVGVLRPVRVAACAVLHVSGRVQRGRV